MRPCRAGRWSRTASTVLSTPPLTAQEALAASETQLREIIDTQRRLVDARPDDDRAFLELNSRFHRALHDCSGNRTLNDLIDAIEKFAMNVPLSVIFVSGSLPRLPISEMFADMMQFS